MRLRFQAHLPLEFWGECPLTTACLINRTLSKLLQGKTPYEVLFAVKPSCEHIKVSAYALHTIDQNKNISLLLEAKNASLWGIHMARKVGSCMT